MKSASEVAKEILSKQWFVKLGDRHSWVAVYSEGTVEFIESALKQYARQELESTLNTLKLGHSLYSQNLDPNRDYGTYNQGIDGAIKILEQRMKDLG